MDKKTKNIIKMEFDEEIGEHGDSLLDYHVKYFGVKVDTNVLIKTIQYLNDNIYEKELTEKEIFINYTKGREETIYKSLLKLLSDNKDLKTLEDFIDYYGINQLLEEILQTKKDFDIFCEANNCLFGTVGYSPWSYFVTWKDTDVNFIRDLYEGWNWYNLTLIEDNEKIDSICCCYIPKVKDLDEFVKDHFGIEENDYFLVDNQASTYYNKPKVKEIKHITYSYTFGY